MLNPPHAHVPFFSLLFSPSPTSAASAPISPHSIGNAVPLKPQSLSLSLCMSSYCYCKIWPSLWLISNFCNSVQKKEEERLLHMLKIICVTPLTPTQIMREVGFVCACCNFETPCIYVVRKEQTNQPKPSGLIETQIHFRFVPDSRGLIGWYHCQWLFLTVHLYLISPHPAF